MPRGFCFNSIQWLKPPSGGINHAGCTVKHHHSDLIHQPRVSDVAGLVSLRTINNAH
jgi:hypothetical protein